MDRLASLLIAFWAASFLPASAFGQEGVINLGPEEIIKANGEEIVVPGYSVPSFADWNNDGLQDLIVGEGGGGAPGKIRVYLNVGTEADPCFADYFYVQSNGVPIDLPGTLRSRPDVCHWTGTGRFGPKDGYWDLLVGYGDGKVHLYRGLPKTGDFNGDGAIDGEDFMILVRALDQPIPPGGTPMDLNRDGAVDNLDLRLFADLWLTEHASKDRLSRELALSHLFP